jgi:hypothetical protein
MVLNAYDRMTIKTAAKAVSHFESKKQTIKKKIEALQQEYDSIQEQVLEYSKAVVEKTGYLPLDLVEKVGNNWVFKYPDTVVPPTQETITEEVTTEEKEEKEEEIAGLATNTEILDDSVNSQLEEQEPEEQPINDDFLKF